MLSKLRQIWSSNPPSPVIGEHLPTHLMRLFDYLQINCVIDIGASRGQYGQLLRQAGFQGTIFSFEPAPSDFLVLQQNAAPDLHWHPRQLALGDKNSHLHLNIFNDSVYNSFLEPTAYILGHGPRIERTELVPVARLDDLFDSLVSDLPDPRVFLKVDTQGYDQFVFRGAKATLPKVLALQSEVAVHPIYQDVPTFLTTIVELNSSGFDLTGLFPIARDQHLRVVEFDCVMVRSSAVGKYGSLQAP